MAAMELFVAVMENGASTLAILASNTFVKSCRKVISKCNFHMINLYHFSVFVVYSVTTFLFQHSGTGIKTSTESSSNGAATTQGNGILVISSK